MYLTTQNLVDIYPLAFLELLARSLNTNKEPLPLKQQEIWSKTSEFTT